VAHTAVLEVFDGGETDDGRPFLVTKLLEGETLEQAREAAGGALSLPEVVAIGIHLLTVLEVAHEGGIVHRDIKPANLFRSRQGMVFVLDFGLARAFEKQDEESPVSSMNSPLGTLGFMAPEQAQGRWDLVGPKTDLFAVAATLLKLSTGLDLYDAPDAQQRFILSTSRPVMPLAQREASLPPGLCAALDRALSFAQRDRFEDAAAFRRTLEDWQKEVLGMRSAPTETMPPPPSPRPASSWRNRAIVVAIGALVGGALGWMWIAATHSTHPSPGSGTLGAPP
jgi:serine/threonine-protein kinase